MDVEKGSPAAAAAPAEVGSGKPAAGDCPCSACSEACSKRRCCCSGPAVQCRGPRARGGIRNAAYFQVPEPMQPARQSARLLQYKWRRQRCLCRLFKSLQALRCPHCSAQTAAGMRPACALCPSQIMMLEPCNTGARTQQAGGRGVRWVVGHRDVQLDRATAAAGRTRWH
jgi:hypothetical protein